MACAGLCAALAACSAGTTKTSAGKPGLDAAGKSSLFAASPPSPTAPERHLGGKPYMVAAKGDGPSRAGEYDTIGTASWYGPRFHGRKTANGEVFDRAALTAAHPTMPLPSYVRVTNLLNDRSIVVRVNDRGPYSHKRLIDVSERTAELLDFKRRGMAQVRIEYVEAAKLDGGDDEGFLLASYRGPAEPLRAVAGPMLASADPPRPARERVRAAAPKRAAQTASRSETPRQVAFVAAEPAAPTPVSEAVTVLSAPIDAEARILMAFETAAVHGN